MTTGRCGSDLDPKTSRFRDVQPASLVDGASKPLEVSLGKIERCPSRWSEARRTGSIKTNECSRRVVYDLRPRLASTSVGVQCCRNHLDLMLTGKRTTWWSGWSTHCRWSVRRYPCRQRVGCLDQAGRLVGAGRRAYDELHVDSALEHGHLEHHCANNGKAFAVLARVVAVARVAHIDALARHGLGERVDDFGHGDTCHVTLVRRVHMSKSTNAKSTERRAEVDERESHYWTVNSRARANAQCAKNGSIMGPVPVVKQQDRVSEGRLG